MEYNFRDIEQKWQKRWVENGTYRVVEDTNKKKFYVLNMFPYPSGAGLHVGHPLGYIASDIYARYKRQQGFNVLNPMGYDAYGLPAEQYAIQTGQHPEKTTFENIDRYRSQLDKIGFCFDWEREVRTCDPIYYKWTQWAFQRMFKSYYSLSSQKAQPTIKLIEHFELMGTENCNALGTEELHFTASDWAGFSEKKKQEVLMNYRIAYLADTMVNWCPKLGTRNWTDVRQFNLMFSTEMGASADASMKIYLRPETAQGIFVNYLNVQKTGRMKIPFGIAQIGKAFRNEIVARQFIFRMREFEQMEMQFFVQPGAELEWFPKWKQTRMAWHQALGFGAENYRFHDHDKLAHYANAATDIEFKMPFGFKEVEGIHSRTNFDLSQHEKYSGKSIKYFDPATNESYTPFVIETSIGVDRMFLSIMCHSYCEEQLENGETRVVLRLPAALAPVKLAVMPLVKKDGLPEKAREIINDLKFHFNCQYDEKDSIGKR